MLDRLNKPGNKKKIFPGSLFLKVLEIICSSYFHDAVIKRSTLS